MDADARSASPPERPASVVPADSPPGPVGRGHRWRRIGGRGLRFLLMGPPIGALVMVAALLITGSGEILRQTRESPLGWMMQFLVLGVPVAIAFGYGFGAVPALLTGAFSGWLSLRAGARWHPRSVALAGGLACAAGWAVLHPDRTLAPMFGFSGAVAGLLCELACRRLEAAEAARSARSARVDPGST